MYSVIVY